MFKKSFFKFAILFLFILGLTKETYAVKPVKDHVLLQSTLQRIGYFDEYITGILNKTSDKNVILFIKDHNKVTGDKLALKADIYAYEQITQAAISCILPLNGYAAEKRKKYCYKLAQIQKRNNLEKIKQQHKDITKRIIVALSKCDKRLIITPEQPLKMHWKAMHFAVKANRLMNWPDSYQNMSLLLLTMANTKFTCNSMKGLLPKNSNIQSREKLIYGIYYVLGKRAKEKELSTGKVTPEVRKLMFGK